MFTALLCFRTASSAQLRKPVFSQHTAPEGPSNTQTRNAPPELLTLNANPTWDAVLAFMLQPTVGKHALCIQEGPAWDCHLWSLCSTPAGCGQPSSPSRAAAVGPQVLHSGLWRPQGVGERTQLLPDAQHRKQSGGSNPTFRQRSHWRQT